MDSKKGSQKGSQKGQKRQAGGKNATSGKSKKSKHYAKAYPRAEYKSSVPRAINPLEFAQARAAEIEMMVDQLSGKSGGVRAHQTLPRHMRRRAMSHNVKRLPRRLHELGAKQIANTLSPDEKGKKKKSRRNRRKPSNLRTEEVFGKRSEKTTWLETHIWHAKRMHMESMWGYHIAITPCDKSVRATHRALKDSCTIYDSSYIKCLELRGSPSAISALLNQYISPRVDENVFFGEIEFCSNFFIGSGKKFLSPLTLICEQRVVASSSVGVFVWIHPGAFKEVLDTLAVGAKQSQGVQVISRQNEFLRFELSGPTAQTVLGKVLDVGYPVEPTSTTKKKTHTNTGVKGDTANNNHTRAQQWELISSMRSSASLRRRAIVSLTVVDPRLKSRDQNLRTKLPGQAVPDSSQVQARAKIMADWPKSMATSKIWDAAVRKQLKQSQASVKQLNERRERHLIPGSDLEVLKTDSRIPILLVQRPGAVGVDGHRSRKDSQTNTSNFRSCTRGYGSGWDLIVPAGWGMAFWLPLVFAGARAIGHREQHASCVEKGVPFFPHDFPDSACCGQLAQTTMEQRQAEHERHPPKHRVNFESMTTATTTTSPFATAWAKLADMNGVLRDPEALIQFAKCVNAKSNSTPLTTSATSSSTTTTTTTTTIPTLTQTSTPAPTQTAATTSTPTTRIASKAKADTTTATTATPPPTITPPISATTATTTPPHDTSTTDVESAGFDHNFLCVHIELEHKGSPKPLAWIYLPNETDFATQKADPNYIGPAIDDRLDRVHVGALTSSRCSLTRGHGFGIGFVAAPLILKSASLCRTFPSCIPDIPRQPGLCVSVLVRDITSKHCRFARATIVSGSNLID